MLETRDPKELKSKLHSLDNKIRNAVKSRARLDDNIEKLRQEFHLVSDVLINKIQQGKSYAA